MCLHFDIIMWRPSILFFYSLSSRVYFFLKHSLTIVFDFCVSTILASTISWSQFSVLYASKFSCFSEYSSSILFPSSCMFIFLILISIKDYFVCLSFLTYVIIHVHQIPLSVVLSLFFHIFVVLLFSMLFPIFFCFCFLNTLLTTSFLCLFLPIFF